ncbi:MAG: Unknown protein [uncultured Sulfurovum sp.]|uniref:AAA+ ATPase domain-containing protein n=1 Tax=uncultured Sulfurovum sp. TaxID=269237 RepID=A0A6S6SJU5_9BACT|nr:MAG: Unknown protein [uncultured Sulfurovum sp.]
MWLCVKSSKISTSKILWKGENLMELVYLWVEDYKNIHKQGFNFSPRFTCDYDDVKKELTIDENDDYIENFFGDNINVTAIIGKNGSGKSSLVEAILEIIVGLENQNITETEKEYILIYDTKYISNITNLNISSRYIEQKIDFFTISLDYALDTFTSDIYRSEVHYRYEKNKKYILEPNKFSQNKANINLDIDAEKMRKRIITYQAELNSNLLNSDIFVPNKVIIRLDPRRIFLNNNGKKGNKKGNHFSKISNTDYIKNIKDLNNIFLTNSTYITEEEKQKADNVVEFLSELKKIYKFNDDEFKMGATANIRTQKGIELEFNGLTPEFKELMASLPRYFLLDFMSDNHLNYTDLSTGEKHLQKLIYTIIDYSFQSRDENILVFIDEIELYLHPQWQKNYINILVKSLEEFLENMNKKIHFVLTTHSPFVISDLLKQNIVFLDKDKKGNCKVVNGLKEKKQTFGANIHTLLSNSFFMEDGLIGEFAKGKIDKAIKLLNQDKLDEKELKYCEQIISIIGEPIVKNQLQRMLDSKRLKKVDEIDAIKQNMIAMQKRLDELEK